MYIEAGRSCREAATTTSLTLRYPLSEAYLLFVYGTLLFCSASRCRGAPALLSLHLSELSHTFASLLPFFLLSLSLLSLCVRAPGGAGSMSAFLHRPLWSGRLPGGSGASAVDVLCVLCRGGRAPLRTPQTPFQSRAPQWTGRSATELSAPPESEDGVGGLRQKKKEEVAGAGRGAEYIRRDNFGINAQSLTRLCRTKC